MALMMVSNCIFFRQLCLLHINIHKYYISHLENYCSQLCIKNWRRVHVCALKLTWTECLNSTEKTAPKNAKIILGAQDFTHCTFFMVSYDSQKLYLKDSVINLLQGFYNHQPPSLKDYLVDFKFLKLRLIYSIDMHMGLIICCHYQSITIQETFNSFNNVPNKQLMISS